MPCGRRTMSARGGRAIGRASRGGCIAGRIGIGWKAGGIGLAIGNGRTGSGLVTFGMT
jgi:hypothetical protein